VELRVTFETPRDDFMLVAEKELIARYSGPHHSLPDTEVRAELFVARGVPIESLVITEGTLIVIPVDEIDEIRDRLPAPVRYALDAFLNSRDHFGA
jgi:hypothetical protein